MERPSGLPEQSLAHHDCSPGGCAKSQQRADEPEFHVSIPRRNCRHAAAGAHKKTIKKKRHTDRRKNGDEKDIAASQICATVRPITNQDAKPVSSCAESPTRCRTSAPLLGLRSARFDYKRQGSKAHGQSGTVRVRAGISRLRPNCLWGQLRERLE